MSLSNTAVVQALYNLYKSCQLNEAVFKMALESPTNLVRNFNPNQLDNASTVVHFDFMQSDPHKITHGSKITVYLAKGWKDKIKTLWNNSKKIEAIKLMRVVASYTKNAFPYDANVNECSDIKRTAAISLFLTDAKRATETLCGTNF
jgi:hypothetical protein